MRGSPPTSLKLRSYAETPPRAQPLRAALCRPDADGATPAARLLALRAGMPSAVEACAARPTVAATAVASALIWGGAADPRHALRGRSRRSPADGDAGASVAPLRCARGSFRTVGGGARASAAVGCGARDGRGACAASAPSALVCRAPQPLAPPLQCGYTHICGAWCEGWGWPRGPRRRQRREVALGLGVSGLKSAKRPSGCAHNTCGGGSCPGALPFGCREALGASARPGARGLRALGSRSRGCVRAACGDGRRAWRGGVGRQSCPGALCTGDQCAHAIRHRRKRKSVRRSVGGSVSARSLWPSMDLDDLDLSWALLVPLRWWRAVSCAGIAR